MKIKAFYYSLPDYFTDKVESQARYTTIEDVEKTTVSIMAVTALISLAAPFLLSMDLLLKVGLGIGLALALPFLSPYVYVSLKAESRKSEMEQILPDALTLISANMKSGHTIEKAFLLSARDEFGPLADELRKTAMSMYGGTPVDEALKDMEDRVKSPLFKETLKLLVDGIESGGNTSELLRSSADDIRNSLEIREEIKSNIRMYMVFIVMAAVFGAPILFSISVYMAETTTTMWQDSGMGDTDQLSSGMSQVGGGFDFQFQAPQVDIEFFPTFAILTIIATNIFSAFIISEIQNGNIKQGVKYIPIFIIVSLVLFNVVRGALASFMGGM
jgi:Flp pilus assembly protein TadB